MAEALTAFRSRLRERFTEFIARQREVASPLLDAFRERKWKAFVFGGTPRGVFDEGACYKPRDIDLVFDDVHFEEFAACFSDSIKRRTRFGGLHLKIGHLAIDAWPLHGTWAFRQGIVSGASFENLPRTTFFNADAIVISLIPKWRGREFYEAGFRRAWEEGILDINLENNPFPALCVVRAFRLASNFRFHFSPRLVRYLAENMETLTDGELVDLQQSHYGQTLFNRTRLGELRRITDKHWKMSPLLPLQIFPGQLRLWPSPTQAPSKTRFRTPASPSLRSGR